MTAHNHQELRRLFDLAIAAPAQERQALLDQECGGDAGLKRRIKAMVAAAEDDDFLGTPTSDALSPIADEGISSRNAATLAAAPHETVGQQIGRYKLLQLVGEGAFGAVYMAEQREPVKRRVALKIIKLGMDTKQVIARFEAERQALAMMDHPNIAKVLDAGATETGRPYFVMELVKGVPITEYCDTENLTTKQRLDLFINVCNAVQHAHQKGIIHRDLKPSNVMVTLHDGKPVPKVIDFGIAKATNRELTDKTLFTEYRQFIGTPEYMSPEQAEMSGLDIDTRSDIYSLGVLLYALLTGTTPLDGKRLHSAALNEIQRIIREEEPSRPSTRLSEISHASEPSPSGTPGLGQGEGSSDSQQSSIQYIAKHRSTDPASLCKQLRGDLDWIIMKALEKDRQRRYETANGFAADIQRHLDHEPVLAGPPRATYKLSKFVRRNRGGVLAAGVVLGVLILGVVGTSWGWIEAIDAHDLERDAKTRAQTDQEIAQAVNEFLNDDLLATVAPSAEEGRGKDVLMRDVLDVAAQRIEKAAAPGEKFADKPLIEASIRATLGETYRRLGEYESAEPQLERARQLRRDALGEEHPDTLSSMNSLSILYRKQSRYDEAEMLLVKTLEIRKRVLGEEHPKTLSSRNNLAILFKKQGRYDEAEPLYAQTLEIQKRVLGEEHPNTLRSMNNLAILFKEQGRYDEAETLYLKTLEIRKRVLGQEHPNTLSSMNNLAILYAANNRYEEAEPLLVKTLEIRKRVLGEEHPDTLSSMNNLALLYDHLDRYDKLEPLYVKTLEIRKRVLGEEHPRTLGSMNNLAILYKKQGRYDEAEPLYVKTLEIRKSVLGEEHPMTLSSMNNLAALYETQGRYEEAEPLYVKTLEIQKRVQGQRHPDTLVSMNNLAELYYTQARYEEASTLFAQAEAGAHETWPAGHWITGAILDGYGKTLNVLQRYEEAETALLEAHELIFAGLGSDNERTVGAIKSLSDLYGAWHAAEPGRGYDAKADQWRAKLPQVESASEQGE